MRVPGLLFLLILSGSAAQAQQLRPPAKDSMALLKSINPVPPHFYTQHLSFFCKKEVQLQKATKLNVYVRLGSKDFVDYLEQKPNARRF